MSFASRAGARIPHAPAAGLNTLLLLHFDDDYVDAAGRHGTFTVVPETGASIFIPSQFGSGALEFGAFDTANSPLSDANIADFEFGTADFTVEAWVRAEESSGFGVATPLVTFYSTDDFGNATMVWQLRTLGEGEGVDPARVSWTISGGPDLVADISTATSLATYTHFAAVRASGVLTLYQNGVAVATSTYTSNITSALNGGGQAYVIRIGSPNNLNNLFLIDEVRVSNVARYTANFTVPAAPFVVD